MQVKAFLTLVYISCFVAGYQRLRIPGAFICCSSWPVDQIQSVGDQVGSVCKSWRQVSSRIMRLPHGNIVSQLKLGIRSRFPVRNI